MTTTMRFDEVVLTTEDDRYGYRFGPGVNTIVGPVAAGKTSLLELLRYGIGGNGVLSQVAERVVQRVTVTARLGATTYLLSRRQGSTTVDVFTSDGTLVEVFSTQVSQRHRRISEFLLESVGIPAIRLTRSGRRPTSKTEPLSFFDVYSFCYVPQSEIDRSVTRHADPMRERKRKATFELLLGLYDVEMAETERRVGELYDRLREARQREATIRSFLEDSTRRPDDLRFNNGSEPALLAEFERLSSQASQARSRLAELRDALRVATADEDARRNRLAALARDLQDVQERIQRAQGELSGHAQRLAQLDLDLQRVGRTRAAQAMLHDIEFVQCPRCMQSITDLERAPGDCLLCGQPEPPQVERDVLFTPDLETTGQLSLAAEWGPNDERTRIRALMDEVKELAAQDQRALDAAIAEQSALQVTLHELELELDERTRSYVSPRFEAISDLSTDLVSAEARQHQIRQSLDLWERHRRIVAEVANLEREYSEAEAAFRSDRALLESRRERVVEFSDIFDEIVQDIQPPWYQSARVDLTTYLPVVNGGPFDTLSGGEKTVINIAYQLALLTFALSRRSTLLPALLILDTPRKNMGVHFDQALAERIYQRIGALADAYGDAFQMIIADNDPPPVDVPTAASIQLTRERPLIRGVVHPGPENVETVSDRMERQRLKA